MAPFNPSSSRPADGAQPRAERRRPGTLCSGKHKVKTQVTPATHHCRLRTLPDYRWMQRDDASEGQPADRIERLTAVPDAPSCIRPPRAGRANLTSPITTTYLLSHNVRAPTVAYLHDPPGVGGGAGHCGMHARTTGTGAVTPGAGCSTVTAGAHCRVRSRRYAARTALPHHGRARSGAAPNREADY